MRIPILVFAILLLLQTSTFAQEPTKDSLSIEKETEYVHVTWNKLVPKQTKLQYAGSMGFLSASIGWYYGKKHQWETDVFLGFTPKMSDRRGNITFTLKETYTPWRISINESWAYEPLTTGIYVNKIFGEYFWNDLPERYPDNYYFWAVNTRFNIFLGQTFTYKLNTNTFHKKELSFFYELSTNDLYVISAYGNKVISAFDIVGLSLGIRYRFF